MFRLIFKHKGRTKVWKGETLEAFTLKKDIDLKGHLLCASNYIALWKGNIMKVVNGSRDVRDERESRAKEKELLGQRKLLYVNTGQSHVCYISAQTHRICNPDLN